MIVVGIPTYNEADNISQLTQQVDQAADKLGIDITIVNADSKSTDNTVNAFMDTPTKNEKVSLQNSVKGKGRNIYSILQFTADREDVVGCMLIDGDITSFDDSWITGQMEMLKKGYDYIIPTYARNYQEGNTTNHFVYPLLGMHFNGRAPRQPIAGDFGLSVRLARHMMEQKWHDYAYGYGIDIFLTLHALCGGFKVTEIPLGKKLHKPSFNKMTHMFREVAASYYETAHELLTDKAMRNISLDQIEAPALIQVQTLSTNAIAERRLEAMKIYTNTASLITTMTLNPLDSVTKELWIDVLTNHEHMMGKVPSYRVAKSILPWYLMRVVTYLDDNNNAKVASDEIRQQFSLAMRQWSYETNNN